mmetsp:Transcript_46158/g.108321  ORF Transcript_46158/g.108321 Transcript_46158/m.108321 type:complete len:222 (+) Transcript_46158:197-862(+)
MPSIMSVTSCAARGSGSGLRPIPFPVCRFLFIDVSSPSMLYSSSSPGCEASRMSVGAVLREAILIRDFSFLRSRDGGNSTRSWSSVSVSSSCDSSLNFGSGHMFCGDVGVAERLTSLDRLLFTLAKGLPSVDTTPGLTAIGLLAREPLRELQGEIPVFKNKNSPSRLRVSSLSKSKLVALSLLSRRSSDLLMRKTIVSVAPGPPLACPCAFAGAAGLLPWF